MGKVVKCGSDKKRVSRCEPNWYLFNLELSGADDGLNLDSCKAKVEQANKNSDVVELGEAVDDLSISSVWEVMGKGFVGIWKFTPLMGLWGC